MKYLAKFHPDSFYHIFNHAVGRENLFADHENYLFFLKQYDKYLSSVFRTFCYCLMPNHFHILIQLRDEESLKALANTKLEFDSHKFVMQKLSNFLNSYAKSFNKRNNRRGALFLDFTKRIEVKDEFYFTRVINYIHQNPVHHGFCKNPNDWAYSSYNSIITTTKTSKLERNIIFDWFGGIEKFVEFHHSNRFIDNEIDVEY